MRFHRTQDLLAATSLGQLVTRWAGAVPRPLERARAGLLEEPAGQSGMLVVGRENGAIRCALLAAALDWQGKD